MHWEVQINTLFDGWVNTWSIEEEDKSYPEEFSTKEAAEEAFAEFKAEVEAAVACGDMEPYDWDEFRIVQVED